MNNNRNPIIVTLIICGTFLCLALIGVGLFVYNNLPVVIAQREAAAAQPTAEVLPTRAADPTKAVEAPAPEPQLTPSGPDVRCWHVNAGKFMLQPGESANGGHIWVSGVEYLFVDDRIVVVTNNSDKAVEINSTDGVGVCNDTDYTRQVKMRFSEGCDLNGCSEVKWVNVTETGVVQVQVVKR